MHTNKNKNQYVFSMIDMTNYYMIDATFHPLPYWIFFKNHLPFPSFLNIKMIHAVEIIPMEDKYHGY